MKIKLAGVILFIAAALLLGTGSTPARSAVTDDDLIWTRWGADHYAIVDDGTAIWVGSGSGLLRWDKATSVHTRLSTAEGLPHRQVYSGALDDEANLWFGGDAGLSKLAGSGEWTHYNKANSGIYSDAVESIATTDVGDIWLGHSESSYVSRLRADGSWAIYPNRQTAVALGYESIRQTLNSSDLWAVTAGEVWVGYDVYNGSAWENRTPAGSWCCPIATAAGSGGKVWALENEVVYFWDGEQWWEYPYWFDFAGELTALAVDEDDGAWVGGIEVYSPYSGEINVYTRLPEKPGSFLFEHSMAGPSPIVALWPADEGMWGIGTNWLHQPDGKVNMFTDAPFYEYAVDVIVDRQGRTWIVSVNSYSTALQTIDDMGTATMADDQGTIRGTQPRISALEPAPNGDLWLGWHYYFRFLSPGAPTRYHGDSVIEYDTPADDGFVNDIFAQDAQHTWFAYARRDYDDNPLGKGIWSLDDGGTPADFSDDVWQTYAIDSNERGGEVAFLNGNLWYGDYSGLYLYQDPGWEKVSSEEVHRLVPGGSGELYVDVNWRVLIVEQDGRQWHAYVKDLISGDLARIQQTERRNKMWTVAPDGAVWYWQSIDYNDVLTRRHSQGEDVFDSPTFSNYIEVGENNRVWLADGALWRMSPQPDFSLEVTPTLWFATAKDSRSGLLSVNSIEGYQETVELSIMDLPQGVTAELTPQSVTAGESAVLTVTTDGAPLGQVTITVEAISGTRNRQHSFTLTVSEHVTDFLLPVLAK